MSSTFQWQLIDSTKISCFIQLQTTEFSTTHFSWKMVDGFLLQRKKGNIREKLWRDMRDSSVNVVRDVSCPEPECSARTKMKCGYVHWNNKKENFFTSCWYSAEAQVPSVDFVEQQLEVKMFVKNGLYFIKNHKKLVFRHRGSILLFFFSKKSLIIQLSWFIMKCVEVHLVDRSQKRTGYRFNVFKWSSSIIGFFPIKSTKYHADIIFWCIQSSECQKLRKNSSFI